MKAVLILVAVVAAGGLALYLKKKYAPSLSLLRQRDTAIAQYGG